MTAFTCPTCGRQGSIKRELPTGGKLRCPSCRTLFAPNASPDHVDAVAKLVGSIAVDELPPPVPSEPNGVGPGAAFDPEDWGQPQEPPVSPVSDSATSYTADRVLLRPADLPIVPPAVHLGYMRKQTCYRNLRMLVRIAMFASLAASSLVILAAIGSLVHVFLRMPEGNLVGAIFTLVGGLSVGLIGVFLAFAFQEASYLLIDIADLLIDQGRKQR